MSPRTMLIVRLRLLQRLIIGDLYSFGLLANFLITGLNYLHNECKRVGPSLIFPSFSRYPLLDLKPENVLVRSEKMLSLDDIVADEINSPSREKFFLIVSSTCRESHPESTLGRPEITDFDAAVQVTGSRKTFTHPIRLNCYHVSCAGS